MKRYYKEENDTKIWLGDVLKVDGKVIINPTEEQILAAGYVEYIANNVHGLTEEQVLENLKRGKVLQLHDFDNSKEVNVCYIVYNGNTMEYWANKHERDALKSALRDCVEMGRAEYRLDIRELGFSLFIPCQMMLQMLSALEIYAIDCYNRTTDHEFAIMALNTREEVSAYDYTVGYPEKLRFEA